MIYMNDKRKENTKSIIYALITIFSFIAVSVGATFAFYYATVKGNDENGNVRIQSAQVYAVFNGEDLEDLNILPGYRNTMEFSITNVTNVPNAYANYSLIMQVIEKFDDPSFTYTLTGETYKGDIWQSNNIEHNKVITINERTVPEISTVLGTGVINSGITHKYKLTLEFAETGENQNNLQGRRFSAKIIAKGDPTVE